MSQVTSRKFSTAVPSRNYAKRRRKLKRTISNRMIIATTAFLSKQFGLLPCFCNQNPIEMMKRRRASVLSKSSNAFWHRNSKSKFAKTQQKNNSTVLETQQTNSSRPRSFQTFRKSIVQRFKGKTITARSVIHKRTNTNVAKRGHSSIDPLNTKQVWSNLPTLPEYDSQHSSYDLHRLASQDNFRERNKDDDNDTLEPPTSTFKTEQQNINATNNISRTIQESSQLILNDLDSSTKIKQTLSTSKTKHPTGTRTTSSRSLITSSKRKKVNKQNRTSKRQTSLSKIKHTHSTASLSVTGSKTNVKRMTHGRSPFPNPNLFHSIPRMQNSDEITEENIHDNHLCCKPITSIKDLSISDKKKLIEHDYLTLISLLPIYLGSQGNFQQKIRDKTNISHDGAIELDRLMNEWGSARLFIGANSPYKTLTQKN